MVHDSGRRLPAEGDGLTRPGAVGLLIGRDKDIEFIRSFVDQAAHGGDALLLTGDPGVGKTALLDVAAEHATARGSRVIRAAGVQFEADLSFAGLNQVLQPLLGDIQRLSATYAAALKAALGLGNGALSDHMIVANAALTLLSRAASTQPLLVVVDDLPWLDRASALVLGFVARRLNGSRVGFLAAARSGEESCFECSGLPEYEVQPLDDTAAAALVAERFPALAPRVSQRLRTEAQGNPLALLELPVALKSLQHGVAAPLPDFLPLSRRLQRLFVSRVSVLPEPTRHLLLIAVLDGTGDLNVLRIVASGHCRLNDLGPAERAGLMHIDEGTGCLTFRHPLTRSAVVELSTGEQCRQVHLALAEQYADQPERRAWHLAHAAVEPDERVAGLLEQAAQITLRRGDAVAGIAGLLRAAELSPHGCDRSRRLAEAAYLGADVTGDLRNVPKLLDDARRADPSRSESLAAAVATSYYLLNGDGDIDTAHRVLVEAIETRAGSYAADDNTLIEALHTLLLVCFFGGRADLWAPFDAAVGRLTPHVPELLYLQSKTFGDPAHAALSALGRLDAAIAQLNSEVDPVRIVRIGIAAAYVDRLSGCREALWRVVRHGREGGAVTSAIDALFLLSNQAFLAGEWDEAAHLAEEGLRLCDIHSYRLLTWPGQFLQAMLAAARGNDATTRALTDEMTRWAAPRRVHSVHAYARHAKALQALGRGDFENAYQHAAAVSPPGVIASHDPHAMWLVLDLVEAAVRTGRHAEATSHVAAVREARLEAISPRLALITTASAAIAATGHEEVRLFEEAIGIPGASRWPFELARVQLAYGERLRRAKATVEARRHLAAAFDTFQSLCAHPWAARAGNELRATGLVVGHIDPFGQTSLTPQQREIALLAAAGLTNKQIGERLYLSHRTIGAHLYQIFPKLGVASRAALRDALREHVDDSVQERGQ